MKTMAKVLILFSFILSLQFCSASDKPDNKKITIPEKIPYGGVKISCTISDISEKSGNLIAVARVDTVYGFGPSASPVAQGAKLFMNLGKTGVWENERSVEPYQVDKHYKLIVTPLPKGVGETAGNLWKIIRRVK